MGRRPIAVSLGSSIGDRRGTLLAAASELSSVLDSIQLSSIIETAAVGEGTEHDPPFLNAAAVGLSSLPARSLVDAFLVIEQSLGRRRPHPNAPRTIDLDLILAGIEIIHEPGLEVPHPRFRERLFVLEPLAELAPEMRDPVTGLTVAQLLRLAQKKPGA